MNEQIYRFQGVDCASCAAKIEEKLNQLDGIDQAQVVFATQQVRLKGDNIDALLPAVQVVFDQIEPGSIVITATKHNQKEEIYQFQGVDCASCAAKIEEKLNQLDGIDQAQVVFATQQVRLKGDNIDALLPAVQAVFDQIEPGSTVTVITKRDNTVDDRQKNTKKERNKLIISVAVFGLLLVLNYFIKPYIDLYPWVGTARMLVFLAYFIYIGRDVLLSSWKNIRRGEIFDENFLMSIASIGAFIIGEYPEAIAVMLFYRVGEYCENLAVNKSRGAIVDAIDMRPENVQVMQGDQIVILPVEDIKVDDIVIIKPGERIPLDGVCIDGMSNLDTSPITGESVPVEVETGSELISGCINQSGLLKMRVEKPLSESMVTRILDAVENAAANKPQIDRFISRFSKIYTPIVCLLAVIVAVLPPLLHMGTWSEWVLRGLTFLVVSCPCALVISVPMTFFAGIGRASSEGILFKGGVSLEALAQVKEIVMDKTGTITEGKFSISSIEPVDGVAKETLLQWAASTEQQSTHPIALSLCSEAQQQGITIESPQVIQEIAGKGVYAELPEGKIYCGNANWMKELGLNVPKSEGTEVYVAKDGQYAGLIVVRDTPKSDAIATIAELKKQGLRTAMLTGDSEATAKSIANEVGIDEYYAHLRPDDKLRYLNEIREKHGAVMFVGDGINDAPVLAGADVGAAMGSGADAAIEAADVVFMNSQMSAIESSYQIAKKVMVIARENIIFALAIKLIVLVLSVFGITNMWVAVFADVGVTLLCILNSMRLLWGSKKAKQAQQTPETLYTA